jgi:hypothetical protein
VIHLALPLKFGCKQTAALRLASDVAVTTSRSFIAASEPWQGARLAQSTHDEVIFLFPKHAALGHHPRG